MKRTGLDIERIASTLQPPWPRPDLPHVAIAGRSNVGKSSLLNKLFHRKKLAGTSKTPGKTRSLQFFLVENKFVVCDLPGYGFAAVSKDLRNLWSGAIRSYLESEQGPRGVIVLIDGRHPPSAQDVQLAGALQALNMPWLPVLTKADKVPRGKRHSHVRAAAAALGIDVDDIAWTSAETAEGMDKLWRDLYDLLRTDGD